MSQATFPRRRDDGSFTVAARFSTRNSRARESATRHLAGWLVRKEDIDHVDLSLDFSAPVRLNEVDENSFEIVFDCRPASLLWKGWMVELTQEILSGGEDMAFEGFWDLVAGDPHPASIG